MHKSKSIHNSRYNGLIKELIEERKRLKLSQIEVAALIQMTQSDISKIENSERRLDILELRDLLEIYSFDENIEFKKKIKDFFGLD